MMLKLRSVQNLPPLDVTTSFLETVIFDPKEMLGVRFEISSILSNKARNFTTEFN